MDQEKAEIIAAAMGGDAFNSGGGIWLVVIERKDGRLVVISDEVICEYESEDDFDECAPVTVIRIT